MQIKTRMLALVAAVTLLAAPARPDDVLGVPLIGQEMSNWCWDASSLMVLQWYGHMGTSQTQVATWAIGGHNLGNSLDANGVTIVVGGNNVTKYGCKQVLREFGPVQSTYLGRALTLDEIETEVDEGRPAILGVLWKRQVGAAVQTAGGHAIVLVGKTGDMVTLNDPWPTNNNPQVGAAGVQWLVDYTALFAAPPGPTYNGSANLGNTWAQTLKTGRALDLCFLIDSTGSMADDIAQVKAAANALVADLATNFADLRIAVVDYKDFPQDPWGDFDDYISNTRLAFAGYTQEADAVAAINSIAVDGGNDWPEAVFSAVMRSLMGEGIGAWREDAERYIVLMGDAPGHDPEEWLGGYSYNDVIDFATAMEHPVSVYALGVGTDASALADLGGIAAATGGGFYEALNAGEVTDAIETIVEDFTENPRAPQGEVAAFRPLFTFQPSQETMFAFASKTFVELEAYNADKDKWKKVFKKPLAPGVTDSFLPDKPLPQGDYRWKLGSSRKSGVLTLPSGETQKIKGGYFPEAEWTEFTRVEVLPGDPLLIDPNPVYVPEEKVISFQVGASANADAYVVRIFRGDSEKPWKTFTLKPPKDDPGAAVLEAEVGGHKLGEVYNWEVQALNFDRPKPTEDGWVDDAAATVAQEDARGVSPDGTRSNAPHKLQQK